MIQVHTEDGIVRVVLDRPKRRNAMSIEMVDALLEAFSGASDARILVIRGAGGHFCAGGDIGDMHTAAQASGDGIAQMNRRFGDLLQAVRSAPFATVSVCEGAVMGGGFGLACATDVTLAGPTARFGLPETRLGISPAQITPFLVHRIGAAQTRRLIVTGSRIDAFEALRIGLAHEAPEDLDGRLQALLLEMRRCEPEAVRASKELVGRVGEQPLGALLDWASGDFSRLARRPEAQQGMAAFLQREDPPWL